MENWKHDKTERGFRQFPCFGVKLKEAAPFIRAITCARNSDEVKLILCVTVSLRDPVIVGFTRKDRNELKDTNLEESKTRI